MFLVLDYPTKPEADDIERGFITPDAIIHLKVQDAIEDLTKRVRFSIGYEANPEPDFGEEEPELPPEHSAAIDGWRARYDSNRMPGPIHIETRDYTHTLMTVGDAA